MASDPWAGFEEVTPTATAPAYPGIIAGRPKTPSQPTPKNPYDIETDQRDFSVDRTDKGKDYLLRLAGDYNADPTVKAYRTAIGQFGQALETGVGAQADLALTYAFAKAMDPESVVRESEQGMVTDSQPWFQAKVEQIKKQFGYTEAGGFTPEARDALRKQISNSVAQRAKVYDARRHYYEQQAAELGVDPNKVLGQHDAEPFVPAIQEWVERVNGGKAAQGGGQAVPGANPWTGWIGEDGKPLGPEGGYGKDPETGEWSLVGSVSAEGETEEQRAARELAEQRATGRNESDAAVLMRQGVTLGLSDEVAGVGTAIGKALTGDFNLAKNYRIGNRADDINNDRARANLGWGGTALEAISGGGGIRAVGGVVGSLARQGLGVGALGGFGYGEGTAGTAVSTVGGGVLGGSLGLAGQKVASALSHRSAARGLGARASVLDEAGRAEGVTVNRAMVDPDLQNAVTKADATLVGGRKVQREMSNIESQIENRVSDLGRGGTPMLDPANGGTNRIALGDKVRGAAERFIKTSGKKAKVKYDRAERLAGDAKVSPTESLNRVDTMIKKLSETPETNKLELAHLQEIKSDLSRDLSVSALRKMRTKLRKKINKGDLVYGEDEANVLAIMDGAADDIRTGLIAQGKGDAARAFDTADKAYAARMDYINDTVQKLLGKRQSNLTSEAVADKFISMTGSDARGLRKFYSTLTPEEAGDVAATFAERLGTNAKDGFTVAQFMRQTASKTMSDDALRTLFGPEGARSVKNLRVLGKEVERVTGAMNSRTSKSGVAGYRDWLFGMLMGGSGIAGGAGGGVLTGTLTGAASGAALATAATGASAARQALSARALMSPKITKWLADAPSTTNPAAIDRHFAQLQAIAKAEPALAGEIEGLRKAIMGAANDNASVVSLAAEDQDSKENP